MFRTVLVANRGEIAVRVIASLRALGVRAVAVYSDEDAGALHTRRADAAIRLGPAPASSSYLRHDRVLEAAAATGAEAVHPGYGFLAEDASFARACQAAGRRFIGPPAAAIETMGDKAAAKTTAEAAGVPTVPGTHRPDMTDEDLLAAAGEVGFPLLVKAAAGGGGLGMRVVRAHSELAPAVAAARREAGSAFGDDRLLLERFLEASRHVEVQVLADAHGRVLHLGERECSLQRRRQKIVEEAPAPGLDAATTTAMHACAVEVARACGYESAGTVEFLVPRAQPEAFCFLEMNTRLQVEHPVTEAVFSADLVAWQVRIAAGEPLPFHQDELAVAGHAIEARIYAEDPARDFLPTGGRVSVMLEPTGDGIRFDSGVAAGDDVSTAFDPLLAKVIAHAPDREHARRRLDRALARTALLGVRTNIGFVRALLTDEDVVAGRLDTALVERRYDELIDDGVPEAVLAAAALARLAALEPGGGAGRDRIVDPFDVPSGWRVGEPAWTTWHLRPPGGEPTAVSVRGRAHDAEVRVGEDGVVRPAAATLHPDGTLECRLDERTWRFVHAVDGPLLWLGWEGHTVALAEQDELAAARQVDVGSRVGPLVAPMPGTVTVVEAREGDPVRAGQTLLVVEAMKTEHPIVAPADGVVAKVSVVVGDAVATDQTLAVVEPGREGS